MRQCLLLGVFHAISEASAIDSSRNVQKGLLADKFFCGHCIFSNATLCRLLCSSFPPKKSIWLKGDKGVHVSGSEVKTYLDPQQGDGHGR